MANKASVTARLTSSDADGLGSAFPPPMTTPELFGLWLPTPHPNTWQGLGSVTAMPYGVNVRWRASNNLI